MILTIEQLEAWRACKDQFMLAGIHFGRRVRLTRAVLLEAAELGLDLDWLACHVLVPHALEDFNRDRAVAWGDYDRDIATAWGDYQRDIVWKNFERAAAAARATRNRAFANALADVLGLP